MENQQSYWVAVVGAGPAGLFAARELAINGAQVVLFNRDIKPGGLAEYGIYPDKLKMKEGLRSQFRQILAQPNIHYYGNIIVGQQGDLTLDDLRKLGFQAILVTVGAQGTKWLGLPGEDLKGVYHAKDLVYHYNQLPPFSQKEFHIGKRVAVIGVGNVMIDITHFLIEKIHVDQVIAIARRGPGELKFDKKELETVAANLDVNQFNHDVDALSEMMVELGQNPEEPKGLIQSAMMKAVPKAWDTHFRVKFLASPVKIIGNDQGEVIGVQLERNTLVEDQGRVKALGTGEYEVVDVDTVIFAIGDRVDENFGLPTGNAQFVKSKRPNYAVEGVCYEVYDSTHDCSIPGVFVAGWARQASTGLVGVARKDGINGAKAVLEYLKTLQPISIEQPFCQLESRLDHLNKVVVDCDDLKHLEDAERQQGQALGIEGFKYSTNQEMFEAMGYQKV